MWRGMREYEHVATEDTLNALRHLRTAWRGWAAAADAVRVQTADGMVVRITVDRCSKESRFAVRRLAAEFERETTRPLPPKGGFERGNNDVVIFRGESWLTPLAPVASPGAPVRDPYGEDDEDPERGWLVTHGIPGQRPEGVTAACDTTDGVMVVSPHGTGWLVRLADGDADALEVIEGREAINDFLTSRGYQPL